ncbi:MAG TPA: formimidoylglutamase [Chitinophagaceae bacterium]|nr:formimidoylglutamase [Chitinophagaceae bacterium]MCC6634645.1 formimidoylglutamase [Chitinophagaceae bacterium]HNM34668.1 formimidoylglutamase [Chitinophagaceae bacterium]HNN30622.1 formimidoylglutamase [Chitinophagaceae bacterium]
MSFDTIIDFIEPINMYELSNDEGFKENQLGNHVVVFESFIPDLTNIDIVIIGCNEIRGAGTDNLPLNSVNFIRSQFYSLYHWHKDVHLADLGNIKIGTTIQDTYAALKTVVRELINNNKKVIILGGSHDVTTAQYGAYSALNKIIEVTNIDATIDLDIESNLLSNYFLMEMLCGSPNFIKHYNHIGFQSYLVHPTMLETIDKLRFDCFRVGKVKENIEEMEPVIRNSNMVSFDIASIQNAYAPYNKVSPNGFTGEEACTLMQFAGLSNNVSTVGIYGFNNAKEDVHNLTAKQISQMLWYFMDGVYKSKHESAIEHSQNFNEFHLFLAGEPASFLQSKRTGRWWMQLPDGKYIACSQSDYILAASEELPERWLRAIERS